MGFLTTYLQSCGLNDTMAALVSSTQICATGVGALLGGFIGDAMNKRWPEGGRPLTALISALWGIPAVAALVVTAPETPAAVSLLLALVLGLGCSWCGGINSVILSEVVEPSGRASIMAWITSLQGSSGALFGAPIVGFLAEYLGYDKGAISSSNLDEDAVQIHIVRPLGKALLVGTSIPWFICALFYVCLFYTYSRDIHKAEKSSGSLLEGSAGTPSVLSRSPSAVFCLA
jgi:MFS family permease